MALIQETSEGLKEIEILRLGRHTAMNGVVQEFTHEILDEIVDTYNPDYFKAPLIISHETGNYSDRSIADSELAYGTPKFLKKVGDRVKAVFTKIAPAFVDWQRHDQILGISPSFYPPNHPSNPYPGKWSLRHVAGLGKSPPAIKGLAPMSLREFFEADADNTAIDFGEFKIAPDKGAFTVRAALDFMMGVSEAERSYRFIATILQRLRDYFIDKEGLDAADKILPADMVQMVIESANMPDYRTEEFYSMFRQLSDRLSELENKLSPTRSGEWRVVSGEYKESPTATKKNNSSTLPSIPTSPHSPLTTHHSPLTNYKEASMDLKKAMKDKGMALSDIAAELKMSVAEITEILEGKKKAPTKLLKLLEIDTADMSELDFEERSRQLEFQQAELAKQAQILAARQAEFDKKEDLDFCEGLIKEGKALPKEKNNLMAIFTSLRKSESTVDFGEGKETSAIEAVKNFMRDRSPVIAFGEYSAPDKSPSRSTASFSVPEGHEVDAEALEVHEKAMQYMETHPNISYIQAVAKVGG